MTVQGDPEELVSFVADRGEGTISVRDELEEQQLDLIVPDHDGLEPASTDLFLFPVDDAVGVTTGRFTVGPHSMVHVRDEYGEHLGGLTSNPREFEGGTYHLEIEGTPKVYVRVSGGRFTAAYRSANLDYAPIDVTFESPTRIEIGARSVHTRPETTVTVPDEPGALLEAVPFLASSVKEFSPERSWPTLRGHPPAIERGDRLHVPKSLSKPDTGVSIEVPPTYADVYRVAPLAFYLGADLVAGDEPALHLDNGHVEPLETPRRSVEERLDELLGRCLLLDSLARIGGYYSMPRHEYDELAPELPFYPPNLYDVSLPEQLLEYLEVEADVLAPYRPQWPYLPTLRPDPTDAELLPSLLDSLVPIRVGDVDGAVSVASAGRRDLPPPSPATTAERVPDGAVRLLPDAFETALDRAIPEPSDARFAVVVADEDRAERLREYVANARQSRLRAATVDVVVNRGAGTVAPLLDDDPDFLYYEPAADRDRSDTGDAVGDSRLLGNLLDSARSGDQCPPVVAVGAPMEPADETALVGRGAVAGLALDAPPSVAELGRFASLLAVGGSVERGAALAELTPSYRFFGKPTHVLVRREHGFIHAEIDARSMAPDEHEIVRWAPVVETVPIGSVTRILNEDPEDVFHLVGTSAVQADVHSTDDVLALLADDDYVMSLNGDPYHGERRATRDLVRDSARRTLEKARDR
ncbi:hypothetical protein HUG10_10875 [Halorarum halophilum]|uniref:Uncharacterized protein n=1 Tax=Halorarum halophilum TaxID=2743090 RepID=A0A7D5GC57_9EURY|nr:hypothetical protein [Halobaculum halophilum]QLG28026.1 hypothetical protein HUG10_10875 [Halobaculum halophilum]